MIKLFETRIYQTKKKITSVTTSSSFFNWIRPQFTMPGSLKKVISVAQDEMLRVKVPLVGIPEPIVTLERLGSLLWRHRYLITLRHLHLLVTSLIFFRYLRNWFFFSGTFSFDFDFRRVSDSIKVHRFFKRNVTIINILRHELLA